MATMRSSSGSSSIRAFSSVVLPEPVPPETRMLRREWEGVAGGPEHRLGESPLADEVLGGERTAPEPADRHGHVGARGRSADGHAGAVLEPRIENGPGRRIEPERPRNVDRRPVECRGGERWCFDGLELPAALDPDVAGAVDHQLGDLRIFEHGLEARQKRLQVSYPRSRAS